ncbi:MAG: thioesterase family protein [Candidatus Thorarchaeota archaeon]|nr:thioesterase family protein [Candidatus Thorarchaeota archaeon]
MPDNNQLHPFDQAVKLAAVAPYAYQGHIPQTYANMVGPFGGIIVAVILNGILSHKECQGVPISVTVNFAGPIADAPFALALGLIRTNRSNQHWTAELTQGSEVATTASAVLANRQETWMMSEARAPSAPKPEDVASWPAPSEPKWIQRYDFKFIRGKATLSGQPAKDSESLLWVRDEPERPLDFLSLAALSDVFFPRVFIRRQKLGVAGTVSLTTYFHADDSSLKRQATRPVLAAARGQRFYSGYFDQVAELWSDEGELLASSIQMVYFKD